MHPVFMLAIAAAGLVACDQQTPSLTASLGNVGLFGSSSGILVTPNVARLVIGQSIQLSTNAPDTLASAVEWVSLQPRIAVVTQDGLVTAVRTGTATILARLTADTNRVSPSTIIVNAVFVP
jgi:uncharacterized protein YjdB